MSLGVAGTVELRESANILDTLRSTGTAASVMLVAGTVQISIVPVTPVAYTGTWE